MREYREIEAGPLVTTNGEISHSITGAVLGWACKRKEDEMDTRDPQKQNPADALTQLLRSGPQHDNAAHVMQVGGSSPKSNGMRLVALITSWESPR